MSHITHKLPGWFIQDRQIKHSQIALELPTDVTKKASAFMQIFQKQDRKSWLLSLVGFCNKNHSLNWYSIFSELKPVELELILNYLTESQSVDLINAIFFYKLYPDKLYNVALHPEKLVSIRARLGMVHRFIEMLQLHLLSLAKQFGLKLTVDHLFHGDNLPDGIVIEFGHEYQTIIQSAIKTIQLDFTSESEEELMVERLHDLVHAYKFWFKPNRLIDASMVLQQYYITKKPNNVSVVAYFNQEMIVLFKQLSTTECLDLYGYFANNDSCDLMHTLYGLVQGQKFDWLPVLAEEEYSAIKWVFQGLEQVMEALRDELKNRHIITECYTYYQPQQQVSSRRRNREAILRIMTLYRSRISKTNVHLEALFHLMDEHY